LRLVMGGSTLERHSGHRITLELTRDLDAPGAARHALDAIDHGLDHEGEYAVKLLMSELVSNAVKYGGEGPVIVEVESTPVCVRVEVDDRGPAFIPTRCETGKDSIGGWGFVLVEQLASRWGSSVRSAQVWFEIDAAPTSG
jgi:anti-sigma regulatory factor (Ser/Thr protein kinase)